MQTLSSKYRTIFRAQDLDGDLSGTSAAVILFDEVGEDRSDPHAPRKNQAPVSPLDTGLRPDRSEKLKKCAKCAEKKPRKEFPKRDDTADGYASYCSKCRNALGKLRQKNNVSARLKHHIYTRCAAQCKEFLPEGATRDLEKYLGYNIITLAGKLEAGVQDDYGLTLKQAFAKNFHLDHIHPLSRFKVKEMGDKEFVKCWAMTNLKIVPAAVNLKKGNKIVEGDDYYKEFED